MLKSAKYYQEGHKAILHNYCAADVDARALRSLIVSERIGPALSSTEPADGARYYSTVAQCTL